MSFKELKKILFQNLEFQLPAVQNLRFTNMRNKQNLNPKLHTKNQYVKSESKFRFVYDFFR
jgi:hypothetical protein